jgi:hypothetical protein
MYTKSAFILKILIQFWLIKILWCQDFITLLFSEQMKLNFWITKLRYTPQSRGISHCIKEVQPDKWDVPNLPHTVLPKDNVYRDISSTKTANQCLELCLKFATVQNSCVSPYLHVLPCINSCL